MTACLEWGRPTGSPPPTRRRRRRHFGSKRPISVSKNYVAISDTSVFSHSRACAWHSPLDHFANSRVWDQGTGGRWPARAPPVRAQVTTTGTPTVATLLCCICTPCRNRVWMFCLAPWGLSSGTQGVQSDTSVRAHTHPGQAPVLDRSMPSRTTLDKQLGWGKGHRRRRHGCHDQLQPCSVNIPKTPPNRLRTSPDHANIQQMITGQKEIKEEGERARRGTRVPSTSSADHI